MIGRLGRLGHVGDGSFRAKTRLEGRGGGGREHVCHGGFHAEQGLELGRQAGGLEGIAAEGEEVVVGRHVGVTQHLTEGVTERVEPVGVDESRFLPDRCGDGRGSAGNRVRIGVKTVSGQRPAMAGVVLGPVQGQTRDPQVPQSGQQMGLIGHVGGCVTHQAHHLAILGDERGQAVAGAGFDSQHRPVGQQRGDAVGEPHRAGYVVTPIAGLGHLAGTHELSGTIRDDREPGVP